MAYFNSSVGSTYRSIAMGYLDTQIRKENVISIYRVIFYGRIPMI